MASPFGAGDVLYVVPLGKKDPVAAVLVDEAYPDRLTVRGIRGRGRYVLQNGIWHGPGGSWHFEPMPDEPDPETLSVWDATAKGCASGAA